MKKFLIITGSNTAREINEFPQCKCKMYTNEFEKCKNINKSVTSCDVFEKWQAAESSLKEYRITNSTLHYGTDDIDYVVENGKIAFEIGKKVECECNDQDLKCIIL